MANVISFPQKPEAPVTVTLTGAEWFVLMLALAGRPVAKVELDAASAALLQQLKGAG